MGKEHAEGVSIALSLEVLHLLPIKCSAVRKARIYVFFDFALKGNFR